MITKNYKYFIVPLLLVGFISCKNLYLVDTNGKNHVEVSQKENADSTLIKMITPFKQEMAKKMDSVIGFAPITLERKKPESNLGNFVADLSFNYGYQYLIKENLVTDSTNVFCLLNHGGLRSIISQGDISIGDCYSLMPFENEIVVVKVSGEKLKYIFKYLEKSGGEPLANMELDITKISNTNSNIKCNIGGAAFDPKKEYYIVTSDYLAKGGDKMDFFLNPISFTQTGKLLRDAIIDEVKTKGTIDTKSDGRLKIKKDE